MSHFPKSSGMSRRGGRRSKIPGHISRYEPNRYREQPLLLLRPTETHEFSISLEDSVSFYIPIDGRNGLMSRGSFFDGKVDSSLMRVFQCFCVWMGWLNPQRWCDMEVIVAVLHSAGDVQDETTAEGVLLYFQHPAQAFDNKKKDEEESVEMQEEIDGPLPENMLRTLSDQLKLNSEDFFEMCYESSVRTGGVPQAKRAKKEDVTDLFPQRILDMGITFKVVSGNYEYEEHLQRCMPEVIDNFPSGPVNPVYPFMWHITQRNMIRLLGRDSEAIKWVKDTFVEGNVMKGVSYTSKEYCVDVYFPPKGFSELPKLVSTHIPRKFAPPLSAEKIREFYDSQVSSGRSDRSALPKETYEDTDVFHVAFGDTYGHEPRADVSYPRKQYIVPNNIIPFYTLCDTSITRDFMQSLKRTTPLPPVIHVDELSKSLHDFLRKAMSPSVQSGMTLWLRDMELLMEHLPVMQSMLHAYRGPSFMQMLLDAFIDYSVCDGHAALIALEMSVASVSIGAPKLKKHMVISGPPASGKNMILTTHKKFTSVYSSSYTPGIWRTFAETVGQFNTVSLTEMPSHLRVTDKGEFVEGNDSDQIIRDAIINAMDDESAGHTRLAKNDEGQFERQTVGTQVPKMLLNVACNSYKIDKAVTSRFSHRFVYKDTGIEDKQRQTLTGSDESRLDSKGLLPSAPFQAVFVAPGAL